jgi:two-component system NtrC family response regulator/two-component system response regulator HydG
VSERILVVDDDAPIRRTFDEHLTEAGYEVRTAVNAEEALALLEEFDPALVVTDIRMPGMSGLELLRRIRQVSDADVAVITAYEEMKTAMEAMQAGAYDYLVKPLDLAAIEHLVQRCIRDRTLRRRMEHLTAEAAEGHDLKQLVGRDPKMIEIYKLMGVLSRNRATVLVTGETGTGKERIARSIHFNSPQAAEPFIAINCTALPEHLLESELFGHVKGAFTGAVGSRRGYFEMAGSGTLLLDEIGDAPPELQAKLLRVLEDQEFFPVGSERPRRTRARVMAASQRPLGDLVREGRFREDLHFRLKVVEIHLPPLRDRKGDIPLLAEHLMAKIGEELHTRVRGITPEAMNRLRSYNWPGNVRELEHALTRAVVLCRGGVVDAGHLLMGGTEPLEAPDGRTGPQEETLAAVEAAHVQRTLNRAGGVKRQAAQTLGISRTRLDRIIEKHRLTVP